MIRLRESSSRHPREEAAPEAAHALLHVVVHLSEEAVEGFMSVGISAGIASHVYYLFDRSMVSINLWGLIR